MGKDKPSKRVSMKEHIASKANAKNAKGGSNTDFANFSSSFDKEHNEKLKEYNKNVINIDEKYSGITPISDVLVRVFVNPMEETDGVLKPNTVPVKAPTDSGTGIIGFMENTFPYSQKAVVIATPGTESTVSVGDIVMLGNSPVRAQGVGKGDNAFIMVPNKFVLPDELKKYPVEQPLPVDPSDSNYGYLLIRPFDIKAILQKAN